MRSLYKRSFFKIDKWGVLIRSGELEKIQKLINGGEMFIRHPKVSVLL